jgi:type I restriction enzyme M protein
LNDDDLKEFVELQCGLAESEQSWAVDIKDIDLNSFDLSVKNPNGNDKVALRGPHEILEEISALDTESAKVLDAIKEMLA